VFERHIDLRVLARLAKSIEESVDRLNTSQKEIVRRLVCNSVIAKGLPGVNVNKDPFY